MEYHKLLQVALDLLALASSEHKEAGCMNEREWKEDICPICKLLQNAERELKVICDT